MNNHWTRECTRKDNRNQRPQPQRNTQNQVNHVETSTGDLENGEEQDNDETENLYLPLSMIDTKCNPENELLLVEGKVNHKKVSILIDGGAKGNFINEKVRQETLLKMDKSNIRRLAVADGRTHMSTKVPQCPVKIGTYNDKVDFYSAPIIYDLILGKPWLAKHNPSINWRTNEIKFSTKDGRRHRWIAHESWSHQNNDTLNLTLSSMQLKRLAKKKDTQMYICLLKDGTEVNHTPKVNLEGTPKYMQKLVQEYSQVFKEIDGPPPKRIHDHQIKTIHDAPPPWRNLYHMSPEELMVLKEELQRLLR